MWFLIFDIPPAGHSWLIFVGNNWTLTWTPRCWHNIEGLICPMSLVAGDTPMPTFGSDLQSWRIHGNHSKAELLGCSSTHAPSIAEMAKMRRHTLGCGWGQWNHNLLKNRKGWDQCPMGPNKTLVGTSVYVFEPFGTCYIGTRNNLLCWNTPLYEDVFETTLGPPSLNPIPKIQHRFRAAKQLPICTIENWVWPNGSHGARRWVPEDIATKLLQINPMTQTKEPILPFSTVDNANLSSLMNSRVHSWLIIGFPGVDFGLIAGL